MSDKDHIARLKASADPIRVAAALGLKGHGGRFFCPGCQPGGGKTPDLAVKDKGFVCFKCGLKGDLLALVMLAAGLDFPKAATWLEDLTGIRPPDRKRGYQDKGRAVKVAYKRSWSVSSEGAAVNSAPAPDPAIYEAFLSACRPVEGAALDWLTTNKGVAPEVVAGLGLRFCGKEYLAVMDGLKVAFGDAALVAAGLLKKSKKTGRLVPSFWHYYAKKAGFLVIPYLLAGRPVYLKTRPPCEKAKAEHLGLVRFLNTGTAIPCLYNVDALVARPDKVMVCEGESDTWTALSNGFAAVGVPGAKNFKAAWVEGFRSFQHEGRSRVYLALDADTTGAEGSRVIADLFLKAGLPIPLSLPIPAGKDLTEFMNEGKTA